MTRLRRTGYTNRRKSKARVGRETWGETRMGSTRAENSATARPNASALQSSNTIPTVSLIAAVAKGGPGVRTSPSATASEVKARQTFDALAGT